MRLYLCYLTLLFFMLSGCSIVDNDIRSSKMSYFLMCMNKAWDYEKECSCILYPKGYEKHSYCDIWTDLRIQGYNVPLEIPTSK